MKRTYTNYLIPIKTRDPIILRINTYTRTREKKETNLIIPVDTAD